jgi:hypothetical protein
MNNNGEKKKTNVIIVNLNEEVQWSKQRDTMLQYLTPVGRLYKQERMVKKKCLCSPDQKIKAEAESKKKN